MKKAAKLVVLGMVLFPIAFLTGCARRCCDAPCGPTKCEAIKREYCGK